MRPSPRRFRPLPRTPSRGLAAALRGLTHEDLIIIYDQIQTDDEGMVSQPEYTLAKPSNGPNDRDHLTITDWNTAPKMAGEMAVQSNCPASSSAPRTSASKSRCGPLRGTGRR